MNKKGWLRIFEAVIAIILILGAILLMYTNEKTTIDEGGYISDWQEEILARIAENESLRNFVVDENNPPIVKFIQDNLLPNLNFTTRICNLTGPCSMEFYIDRDIFAQERIISGTLERYNPRKIRFFVWRIQE